MWARSHTSGLMISTCWRSTSASESGSTTWSVRSRPSARASVRGGEAIPFEGTDRRLRGRYAAGRPALLVHEHDVAGPDALGRRPPGGRLALRLDVDQCALVHAMDARRRPGRTG